MGGILLPARAGVDELYGNPASLTLLSSPGVSFGWDRHSSFRTSTRLTAAHPLGELGGIGAGLLFDGIGPIDYRNRDEQSLGTGRVGLTMVSLGGGVGIGPGSIGGTIHYLWRGASGLDVASSGVTVDLGAHLRFRERLSVGLVVNNLAGILRATYRDGLHEELPSDLRLSASWQQPFERVIDSVRRDPTGRLRYGERAPERYALIGVELRSASYDDTPVIGAGLEVVPVRFLTDRRLGLRTGLNSRGEFGLGFWLDLPLEIASSSTLSFASRFGGLPESNGIAVGLEITP